MAMKKVLTPAAMRRLPWVLAAATFVCCKPSTEVAAHREPPPPEAKPNRSSCDGAPKVNDPSNVAALPPKAGQFCLDPSGSDHGYGDGAKAPLEPGICDLFDGECAIYLKLGVRRVNEARYVDGAGTSGTIDVKLSTFGSPEQALAKFTKRTLSAGDPAHPDTPPPIEAGAMATLGIGNAYVWRGTTLAELTVNDGDLSVTELQKKANELLPPLAKELGDKLSGDTSLPKAAKYLPEAERLPIGIKYELPHVLATGAGPGAVGFYRAGEKRWRVVVVAGPDEEHAHESLHALASGGAPEKKLGDTGFRTVIGETKSEWLFSRKGALVLGVGDEAYVLRVGMTKEERATLCLTRDEKLAKLKSYFPKPSKPAGDGKDASPKPVKSATKTGKPKISK